MLKKIYTSSFSSPLGEIHIGATDKGLCLLEFGVPERIEQHFNQFNKYWEVVQSDQKCGLLDEAENQLHAYFRKDLQRFNLPFDLVGTDFQLNVWNELLQIPYGRTRSYKEQAIALGNLKAIRAVATANGQNRIAIIIPCHRVIGSDGSLVGFGGELWRKKALLDLESSQGALF
ncbi:MAG: methylated-DNA--[protein]-cysteine S-methyltransferase [Flavobacteriales bacterium]|nr:methylated-DNA--[protein]-cysteine S-methyltransferase [Flavobacteriales bacterium]